ncbi:hypothetical protein [Butyrivibrio sp. FC2001]|uniref:hypothetical protein n=1 Tax=Butyrivibrio sp. FC2001 TaxID=1280671 RepID=UPI00047A0BD3|nr:hypothetical protein [Butyrivibrio sp. FC2001]
MAYIDFVLKSFIGEHADIIIFWLGYIRLVAILSVLLHVVLLKHEIEEGQLRIPYEQDWP